MTFTLRYAQEKSGQKLHLVPVISEHSVSNTALCGKRVSGWRMTINVPLAWSCRNCQRVYRQNGQKRTLQIVRAILDSKG